MGPGLYKDAAPTALDTRFRHFVLRWQAERDTAFARTEGFRDLGRPRALESAVAAALCRRSTNRGPPGRERRSFVPSGLAGVVRWMTQP